MKICIFENIRHFLHSTKIVYVVMSRHHVDITFKVNGTGLILYRDNECVLMQINILC